MSHLIKCEKFLKNEKSTAKSCQVYKNLHNDIKSKDFKVLKFSCMVD